MLLLFGSRSLAAQASYHIFLDIANLNVQDSGMGKKAVSQAARLMGKRSYAARLEHLGIERIREIARENGKKGGRPLTTRKGAKP